MNVKYQIKLSCHQFSSSTIFYFPKFIIIDDIHNFLLKCQTNSIHKFHGVIIREGDAEDKIKMDFDESLTEYEIMTRIWQMFDYYSQVKEIEFDCVVPKRGVVHGFYHECSICLEQFNKEESIKELACYHLFHPKCIDTWLERNNECPNCRSE